MERRQIIAVGGRLLMPNEAGTLEKYILAATSVDRPRVCFIGTATGDDPTYIARFYQTYTQLDARPNHLSLFTRTSQDLRGFLLSHNVIHVGGGNTRSMLAVWRHWGIDLILREAWEQGVVLTGSSAGMLCWFASGVTDSIAGPLSITDGLGFLPTSACPHFNGEKDRRPAYHRMVGECALPAGYAADDGVGLHFLGTTLHAVVSAWPGAKGYFIETDENGVTERELDTRFL